MGVNVGPPSVIVGVGVGVGVTVGEGVNVEVGVAVGPPTTVKQAENSDVGPWGPMTPCTEDVPRPRDFKTIGGGGTNDAVPVTTCPAKTTVGTVTEKARSPVAFVETNVGFVLPRKL